jgi:hypothetical protein
MEELKSLDKAHEEDNDVQVIPSLDDAQDDNLSKQIADAPEYHAHKVQTLKELEKDLIIGLPAKRVEDGIDISLLSNVLSPLEYIKEDDETWTAQTFTQLIHETKTSA